MTKQRNARVETIKFKPGKKDMLTEMFEHFGIKVIDVNAQTLKSNKKNEIK